ncbi:uncharacterized protein Tco025E_08247 [Trypanosoma conorhini]|uniref:Uncharacterized protein n=1 Tax=Trypanosoma conorhini TaxID=83891 RepID=A0A3R7LTY5_9TRYP|nr:uncharacterized protein Tco025E_08247 [Trypanosoma conorhini]RNF03277.1 hypothetical protein Tco025E_08247 [Trypanosoma conorhini]
MSEQRMKKNIEKEHLSPTVPSSPPCKALISSCTGTNELLCGRVTCEKQICTSLLSTGVMKLLCCYYWKTSLNPDALLLYGTEKRDGRSGPCAPRAAPLETPLLSSCPRGLAGWLEGTWQAAEGCNPIPPAVQQHDPRECGARRR